MTKPALRFAGAFLALLILVSGCSENPSAPKNQSKILVVEGPQMPEPQLEPENVKTLLVPENFQRLYADDDPIWRHLQQDRIIDITPIPALTDPSAISDSYYDIFSIRITWGQLANETAPSAVSVNWTGGLTHNSAGILVTRATIDFEAGEDFLLDPQDTNVPGIGWVSFTNGDFDGVQVELYHPKDIVYIVAPTLTFHTAQIEFSLDIFGGLEDLDTVIQVDNQNSVAVQAHRVRGADCPSGYLGGEWAHYSRFGGFFFGKWMAIDGRLMGYLKGEFSTNSDGARGFAGEWYDRTGMYQGRLKGKWGYSDNHPYPWEVVCLSLDCAWDMGWFEGSFTDADDNVRGILSGHFGHPSSSIDPTLNYPGHFFGKWKVDCSHIGSY